MSILNLDKNGQTKAKRGIHFYSTFISSFTLKVLAIIFMCCDHIGKCFFPSFFPLYCLGVCSFPLFAFQLVQGYIHTHNLKRYFIRLLIFALVSQVPFMLALSTFVPNFFVLNIFFTLILGLLSIFIYDKCPNNILKILSILAILAISIILNIDYSAWGVILILSFYIFRNNKSLLSISFIVLCILKYIKYFLFSYHYFYLFLCISTIASLIFILLYNGKQGKKISTFFYMFYPIHLSLIYLVYLLL